MTIEDLKRELRRNNIDENMCLIEPPVCPDGALCLVRDREEGGWRVICKERGEYLINEFFYAEHDACRFFLKEALRDPVCRKDYVLGKYTEYLKEGRKRLLEYGFDEKELPPLPDEDSKGE